MSMTKPAAALVGLCTLAWGIPARGQSYVDVSREANVEVTPAGGPQIDALYPDRAHFALKLRSGVAADRVADAGLYGAYGELALGADTRGGGFFAALGAGGGQTDGGLGFQSFSLGVDVEWPVDIVRLGLRPRVGWLGVDRVTSDEKMDAFRGGIGGLIAVDLLRSEGWTLSFDVEPRVDAVKSAAYFEDDPTYVALGARGGFALRFRAPRRSAK